MKLKITRLAGPGFPDDPGTRLVETGKIVIGRGDDCSWRLPDEARTLSKHHCEVLYQGNVFVLRDTSTNGVFVNDATAAIGNGRSVVLKHGDRFRAADFLFGVEVVVPGAGVTPPTRTVTPVSAPPPETPFAGFDAFAADSANDPGLFPEAKQDDWGGEWSDATERSDDFAAPGLGPALFPDAPGLPDFADFSPAEDAVSFGAPAPDDPWFTPAGLPDAPAAAADSRALGLAGRLVDTVQVLHRLHEQMAGRLGVNRFEAGVTLPVGSGASIIGDLLARPGDDALADIDRFAAEVLALAQTVAQTLEASGGGDGSAAPFDEDPFA